MEEDCGIEKYFGPLGKFEDCEKICDRPSHYPESCKTYCPDYIPKDLQTTPASLPSTTLSFQVKTLFYISVGLALFMSVIYILIPVWKKCLRRRYQEFAEERRRRKLQVPTKVSTQEQTDEREQVVPLNHIFEDTEANSSIIGDFENDDMTSLNEINMERFSNPPGAADQSTIVDTFTVADEISHASSDEDFDFGQTFPFHSLPSLECAFENNTDQSTIVDTFTVADEISHASSDEDFDFGQTFPFHSLPSLVCAFENNTDQTRRKSRAINCKQ